MNLKIRSLLLMGFLLLSALSSTSYALPVRFEGSDVAESNEVEETSSPVDTYTTSVEDEKKEGHYYIQMSGGDWDRYVEALPDPDDASVILARSSAKGTKKKSSQRCVTPFTGIASFYNLNGNETASGEIFRGNLMTAAHKTLPLGTYLIVTNLENNKSVRVKVNDRGPFIKGRVLDLSKGAAEKIGMIGAGHAKVSVKPSC